MTEKKLPFTKEQLEHIISKYPTPFHIYDEKAMMDHAREFLNHFRWNKGFKEYFAIKACPNPYIMKLLHNIGFGIDCSSYSELVFAEKLGMKGEDIMFSSNDTAAYEYQKAFELGAIINLDDISHIDYLEKHAGIPGLICFRYNPGPLKEGNTIIGHPEESKYGLTRDQMLEAYRRMKEKGVKRFGVHTNVASNELQNDYFIETAKLLFELVVEISQKLDIHIEFINLGGGIGVPYHPGQDAVDISFISKKVKQLYDDIIIANNKTPLILYFETGRVITAPYGYLVSKVLHMKDTYKKFAGLDASMHNLMRPALYGAYHHITIPGKENLPHNHTYDVTGSLCENNDKFAIDRKLPELEPGDIVVIHDTGAHGHAMGFNYNGKLRSAELLLRPDGNVLEIRRAETVDDYFATLDFEGVMKIL